MNLDIKNGLKVMFGYDAVQDKGRRQASTGIIKSEDETLNKADRKKIVSGSFDQVRNFAIAGWMVRKHLDYVSRFYFRGATKNESLNEYMEYLFGRWSRKDQCDVAGRNSLNCMMRLFESHKILDGDCGLLKIKGGKLQGIEGSRIATPTIGTAPKSYKNLNKHGLMLNKYGAVDKYCICRRETGSLRYERMIEASDMLFDGYFFRFDQSRGVSPFVAAINSLQDCKEAMVYQLVKAKFHAMLGVAIMSDAGASGGDGFGYADKNTGGDVDADTTDYEFELKAGLKLGLKPGHKIDTIESKTPSQEFQDFMQVTIAVALKALDIPTTFWDSKESSYSAMKQDRAEYELSAKAKREKNVDVLTQIAEWKLREWYRQGLFNGYGVTSFEQLMFEFQPEGIPWIDEMDEVQAAMYRIATGLSSRTIECKKHNMDFRNIVDQLASEEELATEKGATLAIGQPGQVTTRDEEGQENPANETAKDRVAKIQQEGDNKTTGENNG